MERRESGRPDWGLQNAFTKGLPGATLLRGGFPTNVRHARLESCTRIVVVDVVILGVVSADTRGGCAVGRRAELDDDERENIRAIAQSHPEVVAAHDLRTRVAGPTAFIQIHIEMDGRLSLARAHEISDEVEAKLRAAYPNAEIMIHQDPEGIEEPRASFPRRVAAR